MDDWMTDSMDLAQFAWDRLAKAMAAMVKDFGHLGMCHNEIASQGTVRAYLREDTPTVQFKNNW
jgi:hypothetical protein